MRKIIRLTESDLNRLVRRIILEQENDYDEITKKVADTLTGKATFFVPQGSDSVGFMVNGVTMPENIMKPRIVTMDGKTGMVGRDKFYPSSDPTDATIEYQCATTNDPETSNEITRKAKMIVVRGAMKGGNGILNPKTVNFIEKEWCSKFPSPPKQEPFL